MDETGEPELYVFISSDPEDSEAADELEQEIARAGYEVWRTSTRIRPGEDIRLRIKQVISENTVVFLACLSSGHNSARRSHQHEELRLAIDEQRKRPPGVPWLIPVRFEDYLIPDWDIGGATRLTSLRVADLFGSAKQEELGRLLDTVRTIFEASAPARHQVKPLNLQRSPGRIAHARVNRPVDPPGTGRPVGRRTVIAATASVAGIAVVTLAAQPSPPAPRRSIPFAEVLARRQEPAWIYRAKANILCTPAIADDIVYFGDATGRVYAVHASTGIHRWTKKITNNYPIFSPPTVIRDTVYIACSRTGIYALDAPSGKIVSRYPEAGGVASGITSFDGTLYFGGFDNNVYAIYAATDAATMRLRWIHPTGNWVVSTPTIANGVLYVGSNDHFLYALDAAKGHLIWRVSAGRFIDSSPTVVDGAVYIGSGDHHVYKFDIDSRKDIWKYRTGGWIFFSSPAVADGIVYIGSTDGKVYAIDSVTGKRRWIRPLGRREIKGSPVVNSGTVYIGSFDHHFCALNAATGEFRWAYNAGNEFTANPVVANGLVYIGCNNGNLYAFPA